MPKIRTSKEIFVSKINTSKDKVAEIYVTHLEDLPKRELNIKIIIDPKEAISLHDLFRSFIDNEAFRSAFKAELNSKKLSSFKDTALANFNRFIISDHMYYRHSKVSTFSAVNDSNPSQSSASIVLDGKSLASKSFKREIPVFYNDVNIKAQAQPDTREALETSTSSKSMKTQLTKYTVKFTIETR